MCLAWWRGIVVFMGFFSLNKNHEILLIFMFYMHVEINLSLMVGIFLSLDNGYVWKYALKHV